MRDGRVKFDRVMRLDRGHIGFVELDGRAIECARGVTTLAFDLRFRNARQGRAYIVRGDFITDLDGGRCRARGFKRIRYDERDGLLLAVNAGKVLSRERMLHSVWGYQYPVEIETRVIDVHIRNLRHKVEEEPSRPFYILAVPGIGYRFTNARPGS